MKNNILVLSGVEGPSLYINDHRVAGPKPWGGGTVLHEFAVTTKDVEDQLKGSHTPTQCQDCEHDSDGKGHSAND